MHASPAHHDVALSEITATGRAALLRDVAFRFPTRYRVV